MKKLDNLFQKKFEEHGYENNDISKFSQLSLKWKVVHHILICGD